MRSRRTISHFGGLLAALLLAASPAAAKDYLLTGAKPDKLVLVDAAARKVERVMSKRIAAVALQHRIGESFSAVVTGAGPKGVFVRVLAPPVEGMLVRGQQGADVGDRLQVKLVGTDPRRGFIDFAKI